MIKFFRKIRLDMISKNKISNYIIYAIGEIFLVVIGILIALQINNWNEERKDRIQEQKILALLREEFISNLNQIENKIKLRNNIMKESSEVLDYMDSQKDIELDSLIQKISAMVLAPTFDPIQNELLNSERLQLIQNDTLRRYLSNWPSSILDLREQENEWVLIYNNITVPFLIDFGIARNVHLSFYNNSTNLNYMQDKNLSRKILLKKSNNLPSVKEILNNKKLEGLLASAVLINEGINWESQARLNQMIKIIELIESEIDK
jgi:hypothetical protein